MVGRSGCGLSINMKKNVLAYNAVVMLKWRQGQDALEKKAVAWPRKRTRTTKVTSKPEQGMNFTVNIDLLVLQ